MRIVSMTTTDTPTPVLPIVRVLIIVGLLLVLTFFLDFVVQLSSPQFSSVEWQVNVMNELINRGVVPLIGLTLVYTGYWYQKLGGSSPPTPTNLAAWQDPKFWTFVLATLLGLLFVLIIPLHFSKLGELVGQTVQQVDQQAAQTELQLQQEQQRIQSAVNSGELDKLLKNPQLPSNQQAILQQLKQDPEALDKQVKQQLAEVKKQQDEAVSRAHKEAWLTRTRMELRSIVLAIGFAVIGWTGLRDHS